MKLEKTRPSIHDKSAHQSNGKVLISGEAIELDAPPYDLIEIKNSASKSRRSVSQESSCKSIKMDLNFSNLSNQSIKSD